MNIHSYPASYFSYFDGHQDCGIASTDLYLSPKPTDAHTPKHSLYCPNRQRLLEALSHGGRHGFDAPYSPAGCHYRWYTVPEICMILERFDGIVVCVMLRQGDRNPLSKVHHTVLALLITLGHCLACIELLESIAN